MNAFHLDLHCLSNTHLGSHDNYLRFSTNRTTFEYLLLHDVPDFRQSTYLIELYYNSSVGFLIRIQTTCLHMFLYKDHVSYTYTLEMTNFLNRSDLLIISTLTCKFTRPNQIFANMSVNTF